MEEHFGDGKIYFDGIFCNSDILAVRVRLFLKKLGVKIPEQVQIIGFDGIINPFSGRYVCSTIEQPLAKMTQAVVTLLMNPVETTEGINVLLPYDMFPAELQKIKTLHNNKIHPHSEWIFILLTFKWNITVYPMCFIWQKVKYLFVHIA